MIFIILITCKVHTTISVCEVFKNNNRIFNKNNIYKYFKLNFNNESDTQLSNI